MQMYLEVIVLLDPVLMIPAFRIGKETPWGGERLRQKYGKYAVGSKIGESIEFGNLSVYESCTADGRSLTDLIKEHGSEMFGARIHIENLPMIKLVDVKEQRSVLLQTAAKNSVCTPYQTPVKAWVVLAAPEDAYAITGLSPSVSYEDLMGLLQSGQFDERHFLKTPLSEGDVICIPNGAIHGVSAGVLLYEIDLDCTSITRRICDWPHNDASPVKVWLTSETAEKNIMKTHSRVVKSVAAEGDNCQCNCLLKAEAFSVYRLRECREKPFTQAENSLRVLTCLSDAVIRLLSGKIMYLASGQTVLIPAKTCDFLLTGEDFLMAVL